MLNLTPSLEKTIAVTYIALTLTICIRCFIKIWISRTHILWTMWFSISTYGWTAVHRVSVTFDKAKFRSWVLSRMWKFSSGLFHWIWKFESRPCVPSRSRVIVAVRVAVNYRSLSQDLLLKRHSWRSRYLPEIYVHGSVLLAQPLSLWAAAW